MITTQETASRAIHALAADPRLSNAETESALATLAEEIEELLDALDGEESDGDE